MVPRAYAIVGVTSAAILAALVAASLTTGPILGAQHTSITTQAPPPKVAPLPSFGGPAGAGLPTWLVMTLTGLLVLYGCSLLVLIALHRRRGEDDEEPQAWPDEVEHDSSWRTVLTVDLLDAAEDQLAALHRGTPRNAIVACWLALNAATVRAGLPEVSSLTSQEYMVRAIGTLGLDPPAITELGKLYREARFSTHVMAESQRELAGRSLTLLIDQLGGRRDGTAAHPRLESAER
jgi:hypothetical protein